MVTATNTNTKTTYLALCGLFAALTAICSWISIPLGFTPVPVNLGTLAVYLTAGLLGPKYGTISITVWALAGAVGVPVFSGFRGGIGVLAGPTGGYIIGYIVAAFIIGALIGVFTKAMQKPAAASEEDHTDREGDGLRMQSSKPQNRRLSLQLLAKAFAMLCGMAACYVLGTCWFMISTNTGLVPALVACVFPFLPGDAIKIIAASLLVQRLKPYIK